MTITKRPRLPVRNRQLLLDEGATIVVSFPDEWAGGLTEMKINYMLYQGGLLPSLTNISSGNYYVARAYEVDNQFHEKCPQN